MCDDYFNEAWKGWPDHKIADIVSRVISANLRDVTMR
jgi:hypothetical protein